MNGLQVLGFFATLWLRLLFFWDMTLCHWVISSWHFEQLSASPSRIYSSQKNARHDQ